jgi:hypothetical protein
MRNGWTHAVSKRAWWLCGLVGSLFVLLALCLRALARAESALAAERRRVRALSAELEPLRAECRAATLRFEAALERQVSARSACAPVSSGAKDDRGVTEPPKPVTSPEESGAELLSESGRLEVAPGGPLAPIAY